MFAFNTTKSNLDLLQTESGTLTILLHFGGSKCDWMQLYLGPNHVRLFSEGSLVYKLAQEQVPLLFKAIRFWTDVR